MRISEIRDKIMNIENEIVQIKKRNQRVEADKAWETSWTRRILIAVVTYIFFVIFFFVAGLTKPFVNSIVPAVAFLLSTLTVGLVKGCWVKKFRNKK